MTYPHIDVMIEFGAGPLWLAKSKGGIRQPVDPDTLPISTSLANELQDWAVQYNATLDHNYPPDSIPPPKEFWIRGKKLTERLKSELAGSYDVTYDHEEDVQE